MNCIDFVDENTCCSTCGKKLKSNIAIIYNSKFLGRTCAKNKGIDISQLPNFTKGLVIEETSDLLTSALKNTQLDIGINRKRCLEYLFLRSVKLADFKFMKTSTLNDIYERYQKNTISDEDYNHISNLIKKMNRENTIFSEKNLHFCYLCYVELNRIIRTVEKKDFFEDILIFLKRNAYLSEKQFQSIKRNFKINIIYVSPNRSKQLISPQT